MRRRFVIRLRITRAAARLLIGAAFIAFPSTRLSPADPPSEGASSLTRTLTLASYLPAPVASYTGIHVTGRSELARDGGDVAIATTTCVPNHPNVAGDDRYVTHAAMRNTQLNQADHDFRCRGERQPIHDAWHPARPAMRILSDRTETYTESPNVKLYVRGDMWVDRLYWYRNAAINNTSNPDLELMYWPNEITAFAADQCVSGWDANTNTCNHGTYNPNSQEVVLRWTVKNATGPSVAYYGVWARDSGNSDVTSQGATRFPLRVRSNVFPTTASGPAYRACFPIDANHGICNGGGGVAYSIRANCTHGVADAQDNTVTTAGTPFYNLKGECRFHIGQNVNETFRYRIDIRLMCVKMSDDEYNDRCVINPSNPLWPECRRRCPANPETLACPLNPATGAQQCTPFNEYITP